MGEELKQQGGIVELDFIGFEFDRSLREALEPDVAAQLEYYCTTQDEWANAVTLAAHADEKHIELTGRTSRQVTEKYRIPKPAITYSGYGSTIAGESAKRAEQKLRDAAWALAQTAETLTDDPVEQAIWRLSATVGSNAQLDILSYRLEALQLVGELCKLTDKPVTAVRQRIKPDRKEYYGGFSDIVTARAASIGIADNKEAVLVLHDAQRVVVERSKSVHGGHRRCRLVTEWLRAETGREPFSSSIEEHETFELVHVFSKDQLADSPETSFPTIRSLLGMNSEALVDRVDTQPDIFELSIDSHPNEAYENRVSIIIGDDPQQVFAKLSAITVPKSYSIQAIQQGIETLNAQQGGKNWLSALGDLALSRRQLK